MKKLLKNRYVQLIIVAIVCLALGALLYPSKTIIKKVEVDKKSTLELVETLQKEVSSLETSNRKLKQTVKERTKIIKKPDGTIITIIDKETDTEEYETKVKEIEEKYQKELALKNQEIEKLKEYNKTEINRRRVGVEVGMLLTRDYYAHVQADVFGPFIVGLHAQMGKNNTLGVGVGFKF